MADKDINNLKKEFKDFRCFKTWDNFLNDKVSKKIANENFQGNFQEKKVKCQTIQNILDNSKYKNKKIDFLNIDIEGAEMKVLNTLNFEIYDPSLICIEILGYRDLNSEQRETEIKNDKIYKFLVNQGYKKVWSGTSYCSHLFTK